MDCKKYRLNISPYIDGELSGDELIEFENHISKCEKCTEFLKQMRLIAGDISSVSRQPFSEELYEELAGKLDREIEKHETLKNSAFNWNYLLKGAATIFAFSIILMILLFQKDTRKSVKQPDKTEKVEVSKLSKKIDKPPVIQSQKISVVKASPARKTAFKKKETKEIVTPVLVKENLESVLKKEIEEEKIVKEELVQIAKPNYNLKQYQLFLGYSFSKNYNSFLCSIFRESPKLINFGIDSHMITIKERSGIIMSYLGFLYARKRFVQKKAFTANWIIGTALASTKYIHTSNIVYHSQLITTICLGLVSYYNLLDNISIYSKFIGIMHTNGYTLPFSFGPIVRYKKFNAFIGLEGTFNSSEANVGNKSDIGFSMSVGYVF